MKNEIKLDGNFNAENGFGEDIYFICELSDASMGLLASSIATIQNELTILLPQNRITFKLTDKNEFLAALNEDNSISITGNQFDFRHLSQYLDALRKL